jgi:glycosyltransferase involved in cell wall biosynthesis
MILFVGHDASLTGAPKSLLLIIEHICKNYNEPISIILKEGGPLKEEYCKLGKVFIWEKKWYYEKNIFIRLKNRLLNNNKRNQNIILKYFYKNKPKVIFNNTVVNGVILENLSKLKIPVISRIPELETVMKLYQVRFNSTNKVLKYSSNFITPSLSGKNNLIDNFNIASEKIEVAYGTILKKTSHAIVNNEVEFDKIGIPKDSFVVGACGGLGWRKGSDLFLKVAKQLSEFKKIIFIWIGVDETQAGYLEFVYEIKKLNLQTKVFTVPYIKDIHKYYQLMDVFLMTSREDPFPLVNLEAMTNGIPVICFKDSGGSEELVDPSSGFVVPYADTEKMAQKVNDIFSKPELKDKLSKGALKRTDKFISNKSFDVINQVIEKYL